MLVQLVKMLLVLLDLFPQRLQFLILFLPHVQILTGVLAFGKGIAIGRWTLSVCTLDKLHICIKCWMHRTIASLVSRRRRATNPCAVPPDLGAPASPSAILGTVVVMVRRAGTIVVLKVWRMEWRSMVVR